MGILSLLQPDGPYDVSDVAESLRRILDDADLCSVATVADDGSAHINTAYYAHIGGLVLYILTAPSSAHAHNWLRDPRVALSVFSTQQPWGVPHRGAQLYGTVDRVADPDHPAAFEKYAAVHPGLRSWTTDGTAMLQDLESRLYAVTLNQVKLTDEASFGEDPIGVRIVRSRGS